MNTAHLRKATKKWVEATVKSWELDEHHRMLLLLAAECYDAAAVAREEIKKHGTVYIDRFGTPRSRPEVAHLRDNKSLFDKLIKSIGLDIIDTMTPGPHGRR